MISMIMHNLNTDKYERLEDVLRRNKGYLVMFNGSPATLHLTRKNAEDFLFMLKNDFGMNVNSAHIETILMPNLAEIFLQEKDDGNTKEVFLYYDPDRAGTNKE